MITTAETYHVPVLLQESVDGLDIKPNGIYVDVTFGGGGHSREILSRIGENGHLYSFDQDEDAEKNILNDNRFTSLTDFWQIWVYPAIISTMKPEVFLSVSMPHWICA